MSQLSLPDQDSKRAYGQDEVRRFGLHETPRGTLGTPRRILILHMRSYAAMHSEENNSRKVDALLPLQHLQLHARAIEGNMKLEVQPDRC